MSELCCSVCVQAVREYLRALDRTLKSVQSIFEYERIVVRKKEHREETRPFMREDGGKWKQSSMSSLFKMRKLSTK